MKTKFGALQTLKEPIFGILNNIL